MSINPRKKLARKVYNGFQKKDKLEKQLITFLEYKKEKFIKNAIKLYKEYHLHIKKLAKQYNKLASMIDESAEDMHEVLYKDPCLWMTDEEESKYLEECNEYLAKYMTQINNKNIEWKDIEL